MHVNTFLIFVISLYDIFFVAKNVYAMMYFLKENKIVFCEKSVL